ncbi:hypothetical protein [Haloarchaeobius baliensis]|uniref:hypothetical protein n=1 Tax=Haloarchaeobius baliensis TaxID=1670458 RepID=UPI003F885810
MVRNRRSLIKGIVGSSALGSIASVSGAKPGDSSDEPEEPSLPIVVRDGRVDLLVTRRGEELNTQDVINQVETHSRGGENPEEQLRESIRASIRDEGSITGEDAAYLLARAVERINDFIDEGYLEITNESGPAELETTEQFEREVEPGQNSNGDAGTSGCGETKYEFHGPSGIFDPYLKHHMYTNDEDTEELKYRLTQGNIGQGALASILGVTTGGSLAIAAIIMAASGRLLVTEYEHHNEGCGVITKIKHIPAAPTIPIAQLDYDVDIETQ